LQSLPSLLEGKEIQYRYLRENNGWQKVFTKDKNNPFIIPDSLAQPIRACKTFPTAKLQAKIYGF